jgi:hypothetical protein
MRLGGKDNYILMFPDSSNLYPNLNSVKTPSQIRLTNHDYNQLVSESNSFSVLTHICELMCKQVYLLLKRIDFINLQCRQSMLLPAKMEGLKEYGICPG